MLATLSDLLWGKVLVVLLVGIGMATSFFECSLAQLYKTWEPDGTFRGGPAST